MTSSSLNLASTTDSFQCKISVPVYGTYMYMYSCSCTCMRFTFVCAVHVSYPHSSIPLHYSVWYVINVALPCLYLFDAWYLLIQLPLLLFVFYSHAFCSLEPSNTCIIHVCICHKSAISRRISQFKHNSISTLQHGLNDIVNP